MSHQNLANTPAYSLPDGYLIRRYSSGDEKLWFQIQSAADPYNTIRRDLFRNTFGNDSSVLVERQLFLLDPQEKPVGACTAWFDDHQFGQRYGRIHWLAIDPDSQGKGLSKPLLSAACRRLQALGDDKAYLSTSTARIAAIKLYMSFGFQPEINGVEDESVWNQLHRHIKRV